MDQPYSDAGNGDHKRGSLLSKETSESFADDEGRRSANDDREDDERLSSERDISDAEARQSLSRSQILGEHVALPHRTSRGPRRRRSEKMLRKGVGAVSDEDILVGRRPPRTRLRAKSKGNVGVNANVMHPPPSLKSPAAVSTDLGRRRSGFGIPTHPYVMEAASVQGPDIVDSDEVPFWLLSEPGRGRSLSEDAYGYQAASAATKTRVAVYCISQSLDIETLYHNLSGERRARANSKRFDWKAKRDISWEDELVGTSQDVLHSYTRHVTAYETDSDANSNVSRPQANGSVNASPSRQQSTTTEWRPDPLMNSVPETTSSVLENWLGEAVKEIDATDVAEKTPLLAGGPPAASGYGSQEQRALPSVHAPRSVHAFRDTSAPRGSALKEAASSSALEALGRDVFCFPYGCIVFWGFREREEMLVLNFLGSYASGNVTDEEFHHANDYFDVMIGEKSGASADTISVATVDAAERLAVSFALSQSASLFVFESRVEQAIVFTKNIPREMARMGTITMNARAVNKMIGTIFVMRTEINLHSDILDTPDYLWEFDYWEPLYRSIVEYMELPDRVALLNSRLDVLKDLMDVLSNQNAEKHSTKLEWIIIWLIVIEVLLQLVDVCTSVFYDS